MISIVIGHPLSGKSTFIANNPNKVLGSVDQNKVEYLAPFLSNDEEPYDGMILHFATSSKLQNERIIGLMRNIVSKFGAENVNAFLMTVPATELIERVLFDNGRSGRSAAFQAQARGKRKTAEDVIRDYENCIAFIRSFGLDIKFVKASLGETALVTEEQAHEVLLKPVTTTNTSMSYKEIRAFLDKNEYSFYHRVDLPYGLFSRGQDIASRYRDIFPRNMENWTVLDIGCASGGFSFEAERRGGHVLASDITPDRLNSAKTFAKILGSKVRFTDKNLLAPSEVEPEKYDLVLLLNVLHHVPNLAQAIDVAVSRSKGVIVMEFPNSHDPLYKDKKMKNLVGPTLMEKISHFTEVRMRPSAKEGRIIAVCFVSDQQKYRAAYSDGLVEPGKFKRKTPTHEALMMSGLI